MKQILALTLITLLTCCSPTKPSSTLKRGDSPRTITKVTKTESNLTFSPESSTEVHDNNVTVTVKPLDVNDINNITYNASNFSGEYQVQNFNIQSYEESLKDGTVPGISTKQSKLYLSMINKLKSMNRQGVISDNVLTAFINKIAVNRLGDDVYRSNITALNTGIDIYNPFKKDGRNFSVYQIDFINNSNENVSFDLSNFIVNSGFEQLSPYDESFYSTLYSDDIDKFQLAKRLNMPDELIIPSGSKVRKYLTTSPLNPENESLSIKLINDKQSTSFDYDVESSIKQNTVSFYNFKVSCKDQYKYGYRTYFAVLENEDGNVMTVKTEDIKIAESDMDNTFSLYAIGFNAYEYSFGLLENFKFDNIKSKQVRVNFSNKSILKGNNK